MWERFVDQNNKKLGFLPVTIKRKLDEGSYDKLTWKECQLILYLRGANSDEF